jgi:hypothetical protein
MTGRIDRDAPPRRLDETADDAEDDAFVPAFGATCTGVGVCSGEMWEDDGERRGDDAA